MNDLDVIFHGVMLQIIYTMVLSSENRGTNTTYSECNPLHCLWNRLFPYFVYAHWSSLVYVRNDMFYCDDIGGTVTS